MPKKITFVGAGSLGFTRKLVRDLLTFPLLADAQITLMDINSERLDFAQRACQRIVDQGRYPATIRATMDREEALRAGGIFAASVRRNDRAKRPDRGNGGARDSDRQASPDLSGYRA